MTLFWPNDCEEGGYCGLQFEPTQDGHAVTVRCPRAKTCAAHCAQYPRGELEKHLYDQPLAFKAQRPALAGMGIEARKEASSTRSLRLEQPCAYDMLDVIDYLMHRSGTVEHVSVNKHGQVTAMRLKEGKSILREDFPFYAAAHAFQAWADKVAETPVQMSFVITGPLWAGTGYRLAAGALAAGVP